MIKTFRILSRLSAVCLTVLFAVSCSDDKPGGMDDPAPAKSVVNVDMSAFSATGEQSVSGLTDGTYAVEFYAKSNGTGYITANGRMTAVTDANGKLVKGVIRGVQVSGGKCDIALKNIAASQVATIKLISGDKAATLIKGGDISMLSLVEQKGGTYKDENGTAVTMPNYLADNGMNLVRLRLYNNPGQREYQRVRYLYDENGKDSVTNMDEKGNEYPKYWLPKGIQDEADVLVLAKRAKAAGQQIMLTFHYSDFWTNAGEQEIPYAWKDMDAATMTQALYDYTYAFMEKMKAQGTTPEYVSLGNETQAGMLYPIGGPLDTQSSTYWQKVQNLAKLYNAGYKAVKASAPESKVIIHLAMAGEKDNYNWYFDLMSNYQVSYDIIGSSYYPFWTNRSANVVADWANDITERYQKDLIFMETAYAWQKTIPNGNDGQISHNGPYEEMTTAAQKAFMLELTNEIKKVKNQRVLGYVYWDPIFIPAGDAGWVIGEDNPVSNSALFDFNGNALPVWDAYRYNN